jgi:iron complex outermembrane receptor protein
MLERTKVTRAMLAATISIGALAAPSFAWAQQSAGVEEEDTIVVTGTRSRGRSQLSTPSPVDVLSGEALRQQGTTELAESLSAVAPSVDFPRPAVVDGTDSIRPVTLRGLGPDQTLVLVNGARRHASALVNVNGSVGRGSAAVDLNAIPTAALDRIEVLITEMLADDGVRLAGARRLAAERQAQSQGLELADALHARLLALAA